MSGFMKVKNICRGCSSMRGKLRKVGLIVYSMFLLFPAIYAEEIGDDFEIIDG